MLRTRTLRIFGDEFVEELTKDHLGDKMSFRAYG